ncbi:copC domain protein [Nocardiopsis sp. CNR-923]|uniref:copper resistance CopC family protein n=1 Tax=Nocardiopsis sp. CNR-923 TaxID=1904965 RepID=UPI0009680A2C|nr:copper resistance CopC family protein [Nocardiopsis sp. CNR-923]OLT27871.1 copC domain protein [Nocardiopsis sp. CNR-923]
MASTETARALDPATARRLPRLIAAAAVPLTAGALALAPAPALAHDVLTGSSPDDGAVLDAAPEEIVLSFNNAPMASDSASDVVVTGPNGEEYQEEGALEFDGLDVTAGLLPLDEAGAYTIGFRVVSSDGHPIQDSLAFTLTEDAVAGAAAESEPAAEEGEEGAAEEDSATTSTAVETDEAAAESEGPSMVALGIVGLAVAVAVAMLVVVAVVLRSRAGSESGSDQD